MDNVKGGRITSLDVMQYARLREAVNHYLARFGMRSRNDVVGPKLLWPVPGTSEQQSETYMNALLEVLGAAQVLFAKMAFDCDVEVDLDLRVQGVPPKQIEITVVTVYSKGEAVFLSAREQEKPFSTYIAAMGYAIVECGNRALKRKRA